MSAIKVQIIEILFYFIVSISSFLELVEICWMKAPPGALLNKFMSLNQRCASFPVGGVKHASMLDSLYNKHVSSVLVKKYFSMHSFVIPLFYVLNL